MQTARHYQFPYNAQSLIEHKAGAVLTTALCWLLTPAADSPLDLVVAATNHTRDIVLPHRPTVVFRSAGGLVPTAVDTESGLQSAGLNIQAVFDDDLITEAAIANGDWDGATLELFEINYLALRMGEIVWFAGRLGTIKTQGRTFSAEAKPLTVLSRTKFGRVVRGRCDVRTYADARCGLDITPLTRTGTVTTGTSQDTFRASALAVTHTYADGRIVWTGGANKGRTSHVKTWDAATKEIVLQYALPSLIVVGDTFTAIEGCARTQAACIARNNILNYRGYPFVTNVEDVQRIIRAA